MATENHSKLQNNVRIRLLKEVSRPTQANERSPTVTSRDGRTSSWLEVANRRRRQDYLVPFASYLTLNNTVTLKSGLQVTQGH